MLRTILGVVSAELDIQPAYKVLQTFTRRRSASAPVETLVSDILFRPFAGFAWRPFALRELRAASTNMKPDRRDLRTNSLYRNTLAIINTSFDCLEIDACFYLIRIPPF